MRLRGFADRASLAQALAWIDRQPAPLDAEELEPAAAAGRVPVAALRVGTDVPARARALEDGYAVRAAETVGASAYAPVQLHAQAGALPLPPGGAALVSAGAELPPGADAVVPFEAAEAAGPVVEVAAPIAPGSGVERRGQALGAGTQLLAAARPILPQEAGLLAELGLGPIRVVRRPRVRLLVAGPRPAPAGGARGEAHGPMLRALVERDGGLPEAVEAGPGLREALGRAAGAPGADLVLVTGRTGTGPDDEAPPALAELGELALHGVALRPGGSAGMGLVRGLPVILLPGDPLACLCAYELLAGRLVRRLGGRDPGLPLRTRRGELRRKLVSSVGLVEVCQVRLRDGGVEPIGVAESGGLAAAAGADGFVLVPAEREGYPAGAAVTVHCYRSAGGGPCDGE